MMTKSAFRCVLLVEKTEQEFCAQLIGRYYQPRMLLSVRKVSGSTPQSPEGARSVMRALLGTLVLFSSVSCGGQDPAPAYVPPAQTIPQERLPETSLDFAETPCPERVSGRDEQCGFVTVPVSPGSTETIQIRVARIFSSSADAKADPVVYLDGGPGGSSVENLSAVSSFFEEPLGDRDLILVDQRGTGGSIPNLNCPEFGETQQEYIENCFEVLGEELDLNQIRTEYIVDDLEAIRKAFGYDEWNLWGISYGTRVALTAMRDHPKGLRSVVIDSVVPLQSDLLAEVGANGYSSLVKIFEACRSDEECGVNFPDSETDLETVVLKLQAKPYESDEGIVTASLFTNVLFNLAYSPSTLVFIPRLIERAKTNDYGFFTQLAAGTGGGIAFGMHLAVQCAEEMPFHTEETFAEYDAMVPEAFRSELSGESYLDYCRWFDVDAAAAVENEAVKSDVLSLIVTGEFDPITPPAFAELVASDLGSSAKLVVIENESHGAGVAGCGAEVVRNFLNDPDAALQNGCLKSVPGLEFAGQSGSQSQRFREQPLRFVTSTPSAEVLERSLEDLHRRLNYR